MFILYWETTGCEKHFNLIKTEMNLVVGCSHLTDKNTVSTINSPNVPQLRYKTSWQFSYDCWMRIVWYSENYIEVEVSVMWKYNRHKLVVSLTFSSLFQSSYWYLFLFSLSSVIITCKRFGLKRLFWCLQWSTKWLIFVRQTIIAKYYKKCQCLYKWIYIF